MNCAITEWNRKSSFSASRRILRIAGASLGSMPARKVGSLETIVQTNSSGRSAAPSPEVLPLITRRNCHRGKSTGGIDGPGALSLALSGRCIARMLGEKPIGSITSLAAVSGRLARCSINVSARAARHPPPTPQGRAHREEEGVWPLKQIVQNPMAAGPVR